MILQLKINILQFQKYCWWYFSALTQWVHYFFQFQKYRLDSPQTIQSLRPVISCIFCFHCHILRTMLWEEEENSVKAGSVISCVTFHVINFVKTSCIMLPPLIREVSLLWKDNLDIRFDNSKTFLPWEIKIMSIYLFFVSPYNSSHCNSLQEGTDGDIYPVCVTYL